MKTKQRAQCPAHPLVPRRLPVSPVSTSPRSSPEGEVGLTEGPEAAPSSPWSAEGAEGARGPTQPSEEIQILQGQSLGSGGRSCRIKGSGLHAGVREWVTECSPGGWTDGPAEPQRSLGGGYSQAITASQRFDLRKRLKRDQLRNMVLSQGRHSPIESMSILS